MVANRARPRCLPRKVQLWRQQVLSHEIIEYRDIVNSSVLQFMSFNPNCNIVVEQHSKISNETFPIVDGPNGLRPLVALKGKCKLWVAIN